MTPDNNWSIQLDWLNIINILGLDRIEQISKSKRAKALKKVTKAYGTELLNTMKPEELDQLVANELSSLMKRELGEISRRNEKMKKEIQSKMLPLKKGRIIGINMSDLRDLDPKADIEDIIKYFSKKLSDNNDDDDDEEDDGPDEDKNGIYI
jgi:hypothetical protein